MFVEAAVAQAAYNMAAFEFQKKMYEESCNRECGYCGRKAKDQKPGRKSCDGCGAPR